MVADSAQRAGLLAAERTPNSQEHVKLQSPPAFVEAATELIRDSLDIADDTVPKLHDMLRYPLKETLDSGAADELLQDGFSQVVEAVVAAYDSRELPEAVNAGPEAYKSWLKKLGKSLSRKGKRLFLPLRLALTGRMEGPEVGAVLRMLNLVDERELGAQAEFASLDARIATLREL